MSLSFYEVAKREYHADQSDASDIFTSTTAFATASTDADGWKMLLTSTTASGWWHFGDKLIWDVDKLHSVEYLFKPSAMATTAQEIYLGVGTAINASPDVIASSVFAKSTAAEVSAGSDSYRMNLQSDDGVTDVPSWDTGFEIVDDEWYRVKFGFKEKVTSVSHNASLPGKSNIQVKLTNAQGNYQRTPAQSAGANLSLNGYTGGLQPVFGLLGAVAGAILHVKSIKVEYEQST